MFELVQLAKCIYHECTSTFFKEWGDTARAMK